MNISLLQGNCPVMVSSSRISSSDSTKINSNLTRPDSHFIGLELIYMFVLADVLRKIDLTNGDQDDQKLSRDSWKTTVESRSRTDLITQHANTMFLVPRRAPINMHIYCDFWNQSKFVLLVTV